MRGLSAQVRISFSSGAAQTKGGGSFCMATYSFESWSWDKLVNGLRVAKGKEYARAYKQLWWP